MAMQHVKWKSSIMSPSGLSFQGFDARLLRAQLSRSAERLKPSVTERQTFYPSQLRGYKKIGTEKWETDDELKAGMKGVNDNGFSDSWTPDEDRPSRR